MNKNNLKKFNLMKNILISLFFVLSFNIAFSSEPEEYLYEFTNGEEVCEIIDFFEYDITRFSIPLIGEIDSDHLPVIYSCCVNNTCTPIIFDVYSNTFLSGEYVKEIIDLNYIRHHISNGNIPDTYFVQNNFGLCNLYGNNNVNEELINVGAEVAQVALLIDSGEDAINAVRTINLAKNVGLIGSFNPTNLALGAACKYSNDYISDALDILSDCNVYITNIKSGYARTNYSTELNSCFIRANNVLGYYSDSYFFKAKNLVDHALNFGSKIIKLVIDLFNNSPSEFNLDIEETEYEMVENILFQISNKELYFHNPSSEQIYENYYNRIHQKAENYRSILNEVSIQIENLNYQKPNSFEIFFTDLFNEPNYNQSNGFVQLQETKLLLENCESLYSVYKMNSATNCLNNVQEMYEETYPILSNELNTKRSFDSRWIYAGFIVLIVGTLFVFKVKRNYEIIN